MYNGNGRKTNNFNDLFINLWFLYKLSWDSYIYIQYIYIYVYKIIFSIEFNTY